jgi:hypothetical protein
METWEDIDNMPDLEEAEEINLALTASTSEDMESEPESKSGSESDEE